MKKKIIILLFIALVGGNAYILAEDPIDYEDSGEEQIDGSEPTGWKKKTVGCGSKNFADWIPYCCRGYNTQCTAYTCDLPVYGCD
jgi:hypothetical protein